jgi:hypothetical protein
VENASRRIVTREGIMRSALSVVAPSPYQLESPTTGQKINFLLHTHGVYPMKEYVGFRVIVTGEELIDPRWPDTPILTVEKLDLPF